MKAGLFRLIVNAWPPLLFAGIKATNIEPSFRHISVVLRLRWYTRNYVGVHFGGSLYSMTDPWYMLMLMKNLGRDYYIWDKHAEIEYVMPGRSQVHAQFKLTEAELANIRTQTAGGEKYLPTFIIEIFDNDNKIVARVKRTLYIKLKPQART